MEKPIKKEDIERLISQFTDACTLLNSYGGYEDTVEYIQQCIEMFIDMLVNPIVD